MTFCEHGSVTGDMRYLNNHWHHHNDWDIGSYIAAADVIYNITLLYIYTV